MGLTSITPTALMLLATVTQSSASLGYASLWDKCSGELEFRVYVPSSNTWGAPNTFDGAYPKPSEVWAYYTADGPVNLTISNSGNAPYNTSVDVTSITTSFNTGATTITYGLTVPHGVPYPNAISVSMSDTSCPTFTRPAGSTQNTYGPYTCAATKNMIITTCP